MPDEPINGGSRPVPDPTVLTTEALMREVVSLRGYVDAQAEIIGERLTGRFDVIEQRLSAIDEATRLRLTLIDDIPEQINARIAALDEQVKREIEERVANLGGVTGEKFSSIDSRFRERDTRAERESRDNKVAVDAAFAAQKEAAQKQDEANQKAIDKSEKATNESINKLSELFDRSGKATEDKIVDLARRVERGEANMVGDVTGSSRVRQQQTDLRAAVFGAAGFILTILAIAAIVLGTR